MTSETNHSPDFGDNGNALYRAALNRRTAIAALRDHIISAPSPRTMENTLAPLAEIDMLLDEGLSEAELMESVHPDLGMRKAAEACKQILSDLANTLSLDRALFDAVSALEQAAPDDPVQKRYIAHTLRDFRRSGVDRDEGVREQIRDIKESLVRLSQEFNRNIREDTRFIELDDTAQLAGLPPDFIAAHPKNADGKIRITTDYPDFVPFMSYAKDAKARRLLYLTYLNRAYPKNDAVLTEILTKRHAFAALVGHPSYASYAAADKMIGSADAIAAFVDNIADIALQRSVLDVKTLLSRKQKDDPSAQEVEDFEKAYLSELVRAESLNFDSQEVRPYLEYTRVKQGVLDVASALFGLRFNRVDVPIWHESVEVFDVLIGNENIGRVYLDMHPRPFKYKHAAMFPLRSGVRDKRLPKAALVCNFPEPADDRPALLEHTDVVTFFHEFGHLLHHLIGGLQLYSRFSGVATEWDFVEVPSQLLEEWAFSYEALSRFAFHFETGAPIPEEMVRRLNRARTFGRGARVRGQMFYAALSYRCHKSDLEGSSIIDLLKETQARYSPYKHMEGTHMHASFGHLEGYSALYYTYMWSLVIVRDLFQKFEAEGLFNQEVAERYRRCILEPGGTMDAKTLVRNFLERDYNLKAFEAWVNEQ